MDLRRRDVLSYFIKTTPSLTYFKYAPLLDEKYICQARHIFVLKPNLVWMYVYVEYQHLICNPESIQDQRKRKNGRKPILSWTLAYTSNILILIFLKPDVADFLYFKRYIWAKELSSRLKLWFSYPFILTTRCRRPLIFQTKKCAWCYKSKFKIV